MGIGIRTLWTIWKNRGICYPAALQQLELANMAKSGYLIPGGLSPEEEACVVKIAEGLGEGAAPIVEIGTLFGFTTLRLAARSKRKIIAVDIFCWNPFGLPPWCHKMVTRKILHNEVERGRVEIVETGSAEFREAWISSPPAMVFLDADHSYEAVRDEINWAKQIGVPIIAGHDYGDPRFGVTRAVDEAFPDGVETCGRVWFVKKLDAK